MVIKIPLLNAMKTHVRSEEYPPLSIIKNSGTLPLFFC